MADETAGSMDLFMRKLRDRGLRLTAQRETLFHIIAEFLGKTTSVQDIWERTREADPSIGIATIYRTLNLLGEMGMVNIIYLNDGEFRLDVPKQKIHLTAFCRVCGEVFQLDGEQEKQQTLERWLSEAGLELLPQSMALSGLCEKCANEEDQRMEGPRGRRGACHGRRCRGMRRFR
ncbi:MAG: transcriptional repressor [Synergistaceae bacterium]|nr:Fur family transcriptional regulator [Synergistota bacterium]NLM70984.1 transcriptional repressor [Synergistaceae bacterium]